MTEQYTKAWADAIAAAKAEAEMTEKQRKARAMSEIQRHNDAKKLARETAEVWDE